MTDWWSDSGDGGVGDYDPSQTAAASNPLTDTTYSPPGQDSPIDQYNFAPDPNAAGGYQTYGPGQMAPTELPTFSNTTGNYPNDQEMANSVANNFQLTPTIQPGGDVGFMQSQQWQQQQFTPDNFAQLPPETQALFNNTYPGQGAQIWAQQANQNAATAAQSYMQQQSSPPPYLTNPWSIGAGTQWTAPGWGVPGFGQQAQQITPQNWAVLSNPQLQQQLAPGYIPGSGTYNQYNLSQGNLFGTIPGGGSAIVNQNYGVGGPGDPTNGLEPQTPQQWIQGDKLFSWDGNMGQVPGTEGMGYIATLFGRGDTPSGISTAAWSAPDAFWQGLYSAINKGIVKPSARGWQFLQQVKGQTPQGIGGAAPAQAASVAGSGGTGPMGAGTEVWNQARAYQEYLTARMNNLEIPGMENQNQQFQDQLAFEKAKQAFLEQFNTAQAQEQIRQYNTTFGEQQRQFDLQNALAQGNLTGMFNGAPTLANQQFQQQTSLGYLNLLAQLRGPGDIFQYLKVLQGTPGGMQDIVNAAAGAYRMPMTGGGNINVGTTGTDISTLLGQLNDPNYRQQGQNMTLPPPNQINAQALMRMSPSQQQVLLAAYEQAGYRPEDVMAIFRNSLPQYTGRPQVGNVALLGR